jgi:hypothetical protein
MLIEMLTVMACFLIVFIEDFGNNRNRLGIIELRVVVQCLMRRLVGVRVFVMVVMIMMIVVGMGVFVAVFVDMSMRVIMICNGASAIFAHDKVLFVGNIRV